MTPLCAMVITGFLGAGKTTLLNRLIAHGLSGRKAGVIVNDFGKVNVDSRLVHSGEHPLLELSNGCVCCSLQVGLRQAVQRLVARGGLDLLIIEASGISVASALLNALNSPELSTMVNSTSAVTVVDARRYAEALHALPVIRDQVVCADVIVLNHCDEVDAATRHATEDLLRRENPRAAILVSEHGNVPFERLFSERVRPKTAEDASPHRENWHAYRVVVPNGFDMNELLARLDQLPQTVERVKGFMLGADERHVLQKVGPFRATLEPWPQGEASDQINMLVIIARHPVESQLKQLFPECGVVGQGTQ